MIFGSAGQRTITKSGVARHIGDLGYLSKLPGALFTKQGPLAVYSVGYRKIQELTLDFLRLLVLTESDARFTRPLISQSLALDTLQRAAGALLILAAASRAVRVAEIKFCDVAMQVLLLAVLIHALHAALEHAVVAFDRVRMHVAAHVFFFAVVDAFVAREVLAEVVILAGFVRHDRGFFGDVRLDDRNKVAGFRAVHMEGTNFAALAIHKRENRVLMAIAALFHSAGLLTNESLVHFHDAAGTAHGSKRARAHGFADAMREEPRGFVLHL
jgi:hypothetical protein